MNISQVLTGIKNWVDGKLSHIQGDVDDIAGGLNDLSKRISTFATEQDPALSGGEVDSHISEHYRTTTSPRIGTVENSVSNIAGLISSHATSDNKLLSSSEIGGMATNIAEGAAASAVSPVSSRVSTIEGKISSYASSSNKLLSASEVDSKVSTNISTFNTNTVAPIANRVTAIEGKIPAQATSSNQLADKAFVNSSIATATATFRGTNTTATTEAAFLTWANALTKDTNDYVFWRTTDSAGNVVFKRYKYGKASSTATTETWNYEYDLNNSSFTAAQWNAINSGITSTLVGMIKAATASAIGLVKPGNGLSVDGNGTLSVKYDYSLELDEDGLLMVHTGQGLMSDSDGVYINAGNGLGFNAYDNLIVKAGDGITVDGNGVHANLKAVGSGLSNNNGTISAVITGAATDAEINAGTSTSKAITPANLSKVLSNAAGPGLIVTGGGLTVNTGGGISLNGDQVVATIKSSATSTEISAKSSSSAAITPANLDAAAKAADLISQADFDAIFYPQA